MVAVFQINKIRAAGASVHAFQLVKERAAVQTGHVPVVLGNDDPHRHIHRLGGEGAHQRRRRRHDALHVQELRPGRHLEYIVSRAGVSHQDHIAQIALVLEVAGEDAGLSRNGPLAAAGLSVFKGVVDGHVHGDGQIPRIRQLVHQVGKAQVIAVLRRRADGMGPVQEDDHRAVLPLRHADHALHLIGDLPGSLGERPLSQVVAVDIVPGRVGGDHRRVGGPVPGGADAVHIVHQLCRYIGGPAEHHRVGVRPHRRAIQRQHPGVDVQQIIAGRSSGKGRPLRLGVPRHGIAGLLQNAAQGQQGRLAEVPGHGPLLYCLPLHQQLGGIGT